MVWTAGVMVEIGRRLDALYSLERETLAPGAMVSLCLLLWLGNWRYPPREGDRLLRLVPIGGIWVASIRRNSTCWMAPRATEPDRWAEKDLLNNIHSSITLVLFPKNSDQHPCVEV